MKKLLSLAFLAIALTGLSGCKSHNGCDDGCNDGLFPSFGDVPKLGFLKHGKQGGCGCDAAPCSTCNTAAPCSTCQGGGYAAGYSGGVLEGNVIEGGVSSGPGCNCGGGNSNGMILSSPSISTGTPTITNGPISSGVMPGPGTP